MIVAKCCQIKKQMTWVSSLTPHKNLVTLLTTEKHIDDFMSLYRDYFPNATVTPKLHLLEDHVVPFVRRFRVGFGFLGEQGAESIHARFNQIRHAHTGIRNPVQRLASILTEHLTQVCPDNVVKKPEPKKRKKKDQPTPA